jgi:hypothetical protein
MDSIPDLAQELMKDKTFIQDLARYSENLLTEKFIRKKYGNLDEATWQKLGEDDSLIEKIEDEKLKRIRSGAAKREKAQQHIVRGPDVLNDIMLDAKASPKHKIDAAKTLDGFAANGPQVVPPAAAAEKFQIVINIGSDEILRYSKPIAAGPEPDAIDHAPQELLLTSEREDDSNSIEHNPADEDDQLRTPWGLIAARKQTDGSGGEPL